MWIQTWFPIALVIVSILSRPSSFPYKTLWSLLFAPIFTSLISDHSPEQIPRLVKSSAARKISPRILLCIQLIFVKWEQDAAWPYLQPPPPPWTWDGTGERTSLRHSWSHTHDNSIWDRTKGKTALCCHSGRACGWHRDPHLPLHTGAGEPGAIQKVRGAHSLCSSREGLRNINTVLEFSG